MSTVPDPRSPGPLIDPVQHERVLKQLRRLARASAFTQLEGEQIKALEAALAEAIAHLPPLMPLVPPGTHQMWQSFDRDANGRRITAWRAFQLGFGHIPYDERPCAHEVRRDPTTHALYNALAVTLSRNGKAGRSPSTFAELFPPRPSRRAGRAAVPERPLSAPAPLAP